MSNILIMWLELKAYRAVANNHTKWPCDLICFSKIFWWPDMFLIATTYKLLKIFKVTKGPETTNGPNVKMTQNTKCPCDLTFSKISMFKVTKWLKTHVTQHDSYYAGFWIVGNLKSYQMMWNTKWPCDIKLFFKNEQL